MMNNRIKSAYDNIANELVAEWSGRNSKFHDRLDYFAACLKTGDNLLDIGCGFGRDVTYFSGKGFRSMGVDISTKMIELGKELYGSVDIVQQDIFSFMKSSSLTFQGIWIRGVLFHYSNSDVKSFSYALRTLLKAGTFVYVQSTNKHGTYEKNISKTSERLTYYFHTKSDYINIFETNECRLFKDLSTEHDICLIFRFEPIGAVL